MMINEGYIELMIEGFKNDPGLIPQLAGIESGDAFFAAQCRGEIEAFTRLKHISGCGDDGFLIGFSTVDAAKPEFAEALQEASLNVVKAISEEELLQIQQQSAAVAEISVSDWYLKFTGDVPVFLIPVIVVAEEMRGKGVFRKLLTPVLDACRAQKMPVALQTHNPDNLEKYRHFGFEVKEAVPSDKIDLTCYNLLKEW